MPHDTEEQRILAEYKHHYEQFRHFEDRYSDLSTPQEARLLEDYAKAREAFNYWLWFVTDRVKAQSDLEPPGSDVEPGKHPTHRHYVSEYRSRATEALVAIRRFDADLNDALRIAAPVELRRYQSEPYSLGYDITNAFGRLSREDARIAGDGLMECYSWAKQ